MSGRHRLGEVCDWPSQWQGKHRSGEDADRGSEKEQAVAQAAIGSAQQEKWRMS